MEAQKKKKILIKVNYISKIREGLGPTELTFKNAFDNTMYSIIHNINTRYKGTVGSQSGRTRRIPRYKRNKIFTVNLYIYIIVY